MLLTSKLSVRTAAVALQSKWPGYWLLPYKIRTFHSKCKGHWAIKRFVHSWFTTNQLTKGHVGSCLKYLSTIYRKPKARQQFWSNCNNSKSTWLEFQNTQALGNAGLSKSQMGRWVPICNSKCPLHLTMTFPYAKGYARNAHIFKPVHCHCMLLSQNHRIVCVGSDL